MLPNVTRSKVVEVLKLYYKRLAVVLTIKLVERKEIFLILTLILTETHANINGFLTFVLIVQREGIALVNFLIVI